MSRVTILLLACVCAGLPVFAAACGDDDDGASDAGTDTDTDTDTDADTDTDTDTDTDADSDSDGDTDACSGDTGDDADSFEDISDDFESYEVGSAIAEQAGEPWMTWNYVAGGLLDPDVSDTQALSGSNSVFLEDDHDLVLMLGVLASGSYQIDFQVFVEADKIGYFNILQRFWTEDEVGNDAQDYCYWGLDVWFDADGSGVVKAENETTSFSYTQDAWTSVSAVIDLDGNEATVTIDDSDLTTWPWNLGTAGESDCQHLGGIDFYGSTQDSAGDSADPGFYVDDVSVVKL